MASPLQQLESTGLLDFSAIPESPAFVYSTADLLDDASLIRGITDEAGCNLLYSVKACEVGAVLEVLAPYLSGFATSSLFEARLARGVLADNDGSDGEGTGLPDVLEVTVEVVDSDGEVMNDHAGEPLRDEIQLITVADCAL